MKPIIKYILISVLLIVIYIIVLNKQNQSTNEMKKNSLSVNTESPINLKKNENCIENNISNQKEIMNKGEWKLIWHDEFNNNCLNLNNWTIENWAAEKNNELQYYTPNNVIVKNNKLQLISRKEKYKGREYTSGAVHSKGKFSFLYGKVEMRAKLPAGQGIFPAFWMMPDKDNIWLPEIDILEMLGHRPNEIWMVLHWLDYNQKLKSTSNSFIGPDFSKDFHLFSIEWTEESIKWLIDDKVTFQTNAFIPQDKMYLYINTAIGGNWPGSPNTSTPFPAIYEIDYVRVYSRTMK